MVAHSGKKSRGNSKGRTGAPQKNRMFILNALQEELGENFHPVLEMTKNALVLQKIADDHNVAYENGGASTTVGDLGTIDRSIAAQNALIAWKEVAPYVAPKFRSVEHVIKEKGELEGLTESALDVRLASLLSENLLADNVMPKDDVEEAILIEYDEEPRGFL